VVREGRYEEPARLVVDVEAARHHISKALGVQLLVLRLLLRIGSLMV
jgi:hypothetical protein